MNINNLPQRFQVYLSETFNLANTLIIKSELTANAVNDYLLSTQGLAISENPAEWKYYQNLAGQYTQYDTPMNIISLDTGETILFSPENLANNPITAQNYTYGSFFYNQLILQYPSQASLIQSIVYPVDINTAINTADGTLLNYDSNLVEPQEYTLMRDLQTWIYQYLVRWNVPAYALSDSLYPAAYLGVLYCNIVPEIINLRLLRCKTIEVHSFHLKEYLNSHNYIGQHINYLTLEQQLYLYRNIASFRRHSGFTKIFKNLINHIAVPSGIIISGVYLKKTTQYKDGLSIPYMNFNLQPLFNSSDINVASQIKKSTLLQYEYPLSTDNETYDNIHLNEIDQQLTYTTKSSYNTKDLLTTNIQVANPYTFTLPEVLYNNFAYNAFVGNYSAIVLIPISTGQYSYISAQQAVYLMAYVASSLSGITLNYLPELKMTRVLNDNTPSLATIQNTFENSLSGYSDLYETTISMLPNVSQFDSVIAYNQFAMKVYSTMIDFYYYTASRQGIMERGYTQNFFLSFFLDYKIPEEKNVSYSSFLNGLNLAFIESYSHGDLLTLFYALFKAATGYDLATTNNFSKTIEAMIAIITSLTSYGVQIINNTTDSVTSLNKIAIRSSDFISQYNNTYYILQFNTLGKDISNDNQNQINFDRVTNSFNYGVNLSPALEYSLISTNNNLMNISSSELSALAQITT